MAVGRPQHIAPPPSYPRPAGPRTTPSVLTWFLGGILAILATVPGLALRAEDRPTALSASRPALPPAPSPELAAPGGTLPTDDDGVDGSPDEDECLVDDQCWDESAGDEGDLDRPLAPTLRLQAQHGSWRLLSTDRRGVWIPIEYQALGVYCDVPPDFQAVAIAFYLDGHPYEGIHSGLDASEPWTCPPLGRHILQARYLDVDGGWSAVSEPVRFEILAPRRPRIIAVHDLDQAGGPVHANATANIRHSELQFVLAQVQPAAEIHVYLDQVHCGKATHVRDCVYQFAISTVATPGDHDLAVRQIPTGAACSLASPLSAAVRVHYYRHDVYVRQGWRPPAPAATRALSTPTPVTAAPSTATALPPLPDLSPDLTSRLRYLSEVATQFVATDDSKRNQAPLPGKDAPHCQALETANPPVAPGKPPTPSKSTPASTKTPPGAKPGDPNSGGKPSGNGAGTRSTDAKRPDPPGDNKAVSRGTPEPGPSAADLAEIERARMMAQKAKSEADAAVMKARIGRQIEAAQTEAWRQVEVERLRIQQRRYELEYDLRKSRGALGTLLESVEGLLHSYLPSSTRSQWHSPGDTERLTYTFTSAAHFPMARYSLRGQNVEQEGLIIYEGMTFAIQPDGQYEVRLQTSTPLEPAALRLQLAIQLADGSWHTLTLPPLRIPSVNDRDRDLNRLAPETREARTSDIREIRQTGYFAALLAREKPAAIRDVRRKGTVRFGYDRAQTSVPYVQ